MKKTLVLCGIYPLPEDSGTNLRTMNFVRYFRNLGEVDLAHSDARCRRAVNPGVFANEYFLEEKNYPARVSSRMALLWEGCPYPVRRYEASSTSLIQALVGSGVYDYILVRYAHHTFPLFGLSKAETSKIIIDVDDICSGPLYDSLFNGPANWYTSIIRYVNRQFLKAYERRCLGLGLSLFCSEAQKVSMMGSPNADGGFVVPNVYVGDGFEGYDFGRGSDNGNTLLFVGMLSYGPNFEGLRWFLESVYGRFKREHPDGKLIVIGRVLTDVEKDIRAFCAAFDDVELHIDVLDVKEYYKACAAVVVPLLRGSGTRIKILEAAAAGRPVLSTPAGAEGLDIIDGQQLLLFRDADEFCVKYKELQDADRYRALVGGCKELVQTKYSSRNFDAAMDRCITKVDSASAANSAF